MEAHVLNTLKGYFYVASVLGQFSFTIKNDNAVPSKRLQLYNLIIFAVHHIIFYHMIQAPFCEDTELFYLSANVVSLSLTHLLIMAMAILPIICSKKVCFTLNEIKKIDTELLFLGFQLQRLRLKFFAFCILLIFYGFEALDIILECIYPYWSIDCEDYTYYFLGLKLYNTMTLSNIFLFSFVIKQRAEYLNHNLERFEKFIEPAAVYNNRGVRFINKSLEVLPKDTENNEDEYLIRRLTVLQRCHFLLCEITKNMVSLFAVPIILITLISFIGLIINLYEGFKSVILQGKLDLYLIMTCVKWATYDALKILGCALPFSFLRQEINKTPILIHALYLQTNIRKIQKRLQMFSLQLIHHKMEFTTWGLFRLDTSLLLSIATAVTTYLVIILQFAQPSVLQNVYINKHNGTS